MLHAVSMTVWKFKQFFFPAHTGTINVSIFLLATVVFCHTCVRSLHWQHWQWSGFYLVFQWQRWQRFTIMLQICGIIKELHWIRASRDRHIY